MTEHVTSGGASWQDGQWVRGPAHFRGEAGHHGCGGADLPQQAAHALRGLLPQAADALRGLLEEVGHQGCPPAGHAAVQVVVVNVDGE